MKNNRRVIILIITIFLISVIVLINKLAIFPTKWLLLKKTEIPNFDILEHQSEIEQEILKDYNAAEYSLEEPYIIIDPYNMNPLSALMIFEAKRPCDIEITIIGDDEYSTYSYTKSIYGVHTELPIVGLYAGRENTIKLTADYGNGRPETVTHKITTEHLPTDFQNYTIEVSKPELMEKGITLFTSCFEQTYTALVDVNGEVRGYLSNKRMAHGTNIIELKNGNMLSTGDEYKQLPYNMTSLFEFNWLGKIFREYEIPNAVHHSIYEMPDGNILAVSNNADMFNTGTREDVVILISRDTGKILKEYDFRKILDETRNPYNHFEIDIKNAPVKDWMHTNSVILDEDTNSIIVSSPTQSIVVSISSKTSEINWILGPHEGYAGSSREARTVFT